MKNLDDATRVYQDAFARLAPKDEGWLATLRQGSLAKFLERGFPTQREEDWKYTSLKPLLERQFDHGPPQTRENEQDIAPFTFGDLDCYRMVFLNGRFASNLSDAPILDTCISITDMATAIHDATDFLKDRLAKYADTDRHRFTALNTAFLSDGAVIRLADDAVIEKPVHLLFLSSGVETSVAAHPRILVDAGRNSRACIIEHFAGDGRSSNFINSVTEAFLESGSQLEHYKIQEDGGSAFHVGGLHVLQQSDTRFCSHNYALGSLLARNDINIRLNGPGAEVLLNGLYVVTDKRHVDNHTRIDHLKAHTKSEEDYRGVIDGNGRAVFSGKVVVHKDAQKTDAQQSNKNLLLSKRAEVDTKPELEIYADDVKCSHGATVSKLDNNAFFYLLSRGIEPPAATALLTFAFAEGVMSRIGIPAVHRHLELLVRRQLPNSGYIEEIV